jgi:hypothetical protein
MGTLREYRSATRTDTTTTNNITGIQLLQQQRNKAQHGKSNNGSCKPPSHIYEPNESHESTHPKPIQPSNSRFVRTAQTKPNATSNPNRKQRQIQTKRKSNNVKLNQTQRHPHRQTQTQRQTQHQPHRQTQTQRQPQHQPHRQTQTKPNVKCKATKYNIENLFLQETSNLQPRLLPLLGIRCRIRFR